MDDFLWRAILGAALLGAACGPIGCFVLWRRMAYLGESLAHMGLLGAGLGLLIGVNVVVGVAALGIVAALVMARAGHGAIPAGTFIGIIGHVGLALGFILLASMVSVRTDLMGYLFGDVLAVSPADLLITALVCLAILGATALLWRKLLVFTVSPAIARAEKRHGRFAEIAFLVVIALLVAFGLKIVGALLIIALILIPPAAARPLARTPEAMAAIAALVGALSAPLGIAGALASDAPAGPCIVLAAALLFALSGIAARMRRA